MPLVRADVRGVCFAHWPVDPTDLSARLPPPLTAATRDGTAWVSVLAQRTIGGVRCVPLRYGFSQVAIRTYVRPDGASRSADGERPPGGTSRSADGGHRASEPDRSDVGVYFLGILADTPATGLARRVFGIPFHRASVRLARNGADGGTTVHVERPDEGVLYDGTVRPTGDPSPVERESLIDWLVERYRYYLPDGRSGTVAHDPWTVTSAEGTVRTRAVFDWAGAPDPVGDPVLCYSPGTDIWLRDRP